MSKIKTAVITGQHAFDVPGFHELFRSIPPKLIFIYTAIWRTLRRMLANPCGCPAVRDQYDALVFYNFHRVTCLMRGESGKP